MKSLLQKLLKILAKAILKKYHPKVVGITGSVGKTSTKEALYVVLSSRFKVRKNIKNYNNEVGLPLSIIGEESPGRSIGGWVVLLFKALKLVLARSSEYPEILVLEMGIDRPRDMQYFTDFIKSDIGVVSAIGEIPVHIEFFGSLENVVKEKSVLVNSLAPEKVAVLNYDDRSVYNMKKNTKAKIITFGLKKGADVRAIEISFSEGQWTLENGTVGISFKVVYQGNTVPVRLFNIVGYQQVYAALAAIAVGVSLDMNLLEIVEGLKKYQSPPGRMKILKGIKNTLILDDSYNAAPLSTKEALRVLKEIKVEGNNRKIAVLGDMLELGEFSEQAHRDIGNIVAKTATLLITIGDKSKFIAEEAKRSGMDKNLILVYNDSFEAGKSLQRVLKENDVVLIKGSQGVRAERVVEEVMAEPQYAKELLVRQDESWKK